ncbi:MAG: DUF3253 domain-containing protein [Pseudomonadota bacterium]
MSDDQIAEVLLDLAHRRGTGKTFCPSEAARALDPKDWRRLMPEVRRIAARLQAEGALTATRRGQTVGAEAPGGPIRLGLP